MRFVWTIFLNTVVVLSAITMAAAQKSAQTADPAKVDAGNSPAPTGRLIGAVICSDTNEPGRGAYVYLKHAPLRGEKWSLRPADFSTNVGLDGTYQFDELPPGVYAVTAALSGYLDIGRFDKQGNDVDHSAELVTVSNSGVATHDLILNRAATLSGTVHFSDGSPAINVNIVVEDADATPPKRIASNFFGDHTDDEGRYRIVSLPTGRLLVSVAPDSNGGTIFYNEPRPPVVVYSPNVFARIAAKVYDVHERENFTGADIEIPLGAFYRVSGRLVSVEGRPLNMGTVSLVSTTDDTVVLKDYAGEDGRFLFSTVPSGTYRLLSSEVAFGVRAGSQKENSNGSAPLTPIKTFADTARTLIVNDDTLDIVITPQETSVPSKANSSTGKQ